MLPLQDYKTSVLYPKQNGHPIRCGVFHHFLTGPPISTCFVFGPGENMALYELMPGLKMVLGNWEPTEQNSVAIGHNDTEFHF